MNDNFSLPTIDSVDSGVASISSSYSSAAQSNKAKLTRLQTIQSAEDLSATDLEESMRENEKNILKIMQDPQDLKINEFVKSRFTNAFLVENIGTEMTYSISNRVEHTKNYEKYFFQLERNAQRCIIESITKEIVDYVIVFIIVIVIVVVKKKIQIIVIVFVIV